MTLLKRGGTAKGRKELAYTINIEESKLLKWVNHADQFRIHGVGSEYSDLLEAAGVDTVPELKQRNATALYDALVKTKKLVRQLPTPDQVAEWVEEAKSLPRVIEYETHVNQSQKEMIMTEEKRACLIEPSMP